VLFQPDIHIILTIT